MTLELLVSVKGGAWPARAAALRLNRDHIPGRDARCTANHPKTRVKILSNPEGFL